MESRKRKHGTLGDKWTHDVVMPETKKIAFICSRSTTFVNHQLNAKIALGSLDLNHCVI